MELISTAATDRLPEWSDDYLPQLSPAGLEDMFLARYPRFADALSFDREGAAGALNRLRLARNEFETDAGGGRGQSYRAAQRSTTARLTGIEKLLRMVSGHGDLRRLPPGMRLLDLLGGDGLVARALDLLAPDLGETPILTSDVAQHMVSEALAHGLPTMRQSVDFLFLREASFDGCLIAYGLHHVDGEDRGVMCAEAYRVLRPGGRLVLHDFEEGTPTTRWFTEIVHPHTAAGHDYRHFTRSELHSLLTGSGFVDVTVSDVYDPIRLSGSSEDDAVDRLLSYLIAMYGLQLDLDGKRYLLDWLQHNVHYDFEGVPGADGQWCSRLSVSTTNHGAVAELPRLALVATGSRESGRNRP